MHTFFLQAARTGRLLLFGSMRLPVAAWIFFLIVLPVTPVYVTAVHSEMLDFETVLTQAVEHSWEKRIARKETEIARSALLEARSVYYPSLSLLFYNDYVSYLGAGTGVITVGDQVSANVRSSWQSSFVLGLSWPLYDFGAREKKYRMAVGDTAIAELKEAQADLDVRLKVLDAYARCVRLSRQVETIGDIARLRKEIYRLLRDLRDSGTVGRLRLDRAAVDVAEADARLDDLEESLIRSREDLTYFTGRQYRRGETLFSDLPSPPSFKRAPATENLPQIRLAEAEIEKAANERSMQLREMLPNLSLSANYRMFGGDFNDLGRSVGGLAERDATVALVLRWEFFNGFRDMARLQKLQQRIEQLRLERDRQASDIERQVRTASEAAGLNVPAQERLGDGRQALGRNGEALARLGEHQVLDRVSFLEQNVALLEQEMDMRIKINDRRLAGWQMKFWSEKGQP